MNNYGIARKLYIFSFSLILLLTLLAVSSWSQLGIVSSLASDSGLVKVRQLALISSTELSVTKVLLQIRQALLFPEKDKVKEALNEIEMEIKSISRNDAEFLNALPSKEAKDKFGLWLNLQKDAWPLVLRNMQIISTGDSDSGLKLLSSGTIPSVAKMQNWLNAERSNQEKYLTEEVSQIEALSNNIRQRLMAITIFIAFSLLLFSFYITKIIRRRIATSQSVAELVRDGDLYTRHSDAIKDEFTPLLAALTIMQDALAKVVGTVRENAEFVAMASAEIAQGNVDLSQRTESQASALEQTSASMEELGTTAQQNVLNAAEANRLAFNASDIAVEAGDVVARVVVTMKTLNERSKEISQIVSVIDGIAFQTNILSLNAAVEAARAGAQGAGFAVVASEVRNLAHRSADAAKQIKELIETSVHRIEQGVVLADDAGSTMNRVVTAFKDVTVIMKDISIAGAEQGASVSQVSQAILEMDSTTQQNSALVEQSAAAAENLKMQSNELVNVVSVFRLSATDSSLQVRGVSGTENLGKKMTLQLGVR